MTAQHPAGPGDRPEEPVARPEEPVARPEEPVARPEEPVARPAAAAANSDPSPAVIELYKLAVEMADRVSARRTTANSFFLALHATVATIVGLLGFQTVATGAPGAPGAAAPTHDPVPTLVIGLVGVLLSAAWWLGLRSYRDLNTAKFTVITRLEERLPVDIFRAEWQLLKRDKISRWRGRYAEQGAVERVVPLIFVALYVAAIVLAFIR